jgi:hypothetical protein
MMNFQVDSIFHFGAVEHDLSNFAFLFIQDLI